MVLTSNENNRKIRALISVEYIDKIHILNKVSLLRIDAYSVMYRYRVSINHGKVVLGYVSKFLSH